MCDREVFFLRPNLNFAFFEPFLGKSNDRLTFRLLSYTAIKRLLLSLALAMFNNYNGRWAMWSEGITVE